MSRPIYRMGRRHEASRVRPARTMVPLLRTRRSRSEGAVSSSATTAAARRGPGRDPGGARRRPLRGPANRAANEKSRRSLYGYVRWKIGSEDESRPGSVRFGRGACTSYVMLEFRDDDDPAENSRADSDSRRPNRTREIAKLTSCCPAPASPTSRPWCGGKLLGADRAPTTRFPRAAPSGRSAVLARCRDLPRGSPATAGRAPRIVPPADRQGAGLQADRPGAAVRLRLPVDPRPIDTAALQSNLEHYKRLEGEAAEAAARIVELDAIVTEGERIRAEQRTARAITTSSCGPRVSAPRPKSPESRKA